MLTVRPWLFPMKYLAPWMVFVLVMMTCMSIFMENGKLDMVSVFGLLFGWVVCLPGLLGLLVAMNRSFAKKGDFFKVDVANRTLELCRVGRTLKASEIAAFAILTRWYRCNGGSMWTETHQTSVLVRSQDSRIDLYPLVRVLAENVNSSQKSQWADRLATVFDVPVRRIELSRSESRALNDC